MFRATTLKIWMRRCIPSAYQVPLKYYYNRCASMLEAEMALLPELIRRGQTFVDVGANRGIYVYRCWQLGASLEIFEPNADCARVLATWAVGKPNVRVHEVALSDVDGPATLYIPVDDAGVEHDASASLTTPAPAGMRKQAVLARPLDSFELAAAHLVKIDVEGHEECVLRGAVQTLRRLKPTLLVEIEQRHAERSIYEVFAQICDLGYEGYFLRGSTLLPLTAFSIERDQDPSKRGKPGRYINNFLFCHVDCRSRRPFAPSAVHK